MNSELHWKEILSKTFHGKKGEGKKRLKPKPKELTRLGKKNVCVYMQHDPQRTPTSRAT